MRDDGTLGQGGSGGKNSSDLEYNLKVELLSKR